MPAQKTLLCRPRDGFNDSLNQIERCWRHAEEHHRHLIIDSTRLAFHDHFNNYFEPVDPRANVTLRLDPRREALLNPLSTHPKELRGRLSSYRAIRDHVRRLYADDKTGVPTSFDFELAHAEDLLVHESGNGGPNGVDCLARLRLTKNVASQIRRNLSKLDSKYVAIHVRNSDYRTDYHHLFESLRGRIAGTQILICSDDPNCKTFAKTFFPAGSIVEVTETPHYSGIALHLDEQLKETVGNTAINVNMLTDLLALAGAQQLHYADVDRGRPSGFSELAKALQGRKDIVDQLLSNADVALSESAHLRNVELPAR